MTRPVSTCSSFTDQQQLHRLRELVAAVAQLLEGFAVTLRGLLRRFREALREHPDLSHRRHVEGGEGALARVVRDDRRVDHQERHQRRGQDLELLSRRQAPDERERPCEPRARAHRLGVRQRRAAAADER